MPAEERSAGQARAAASALAGLQPRVLLVQHVDAAAAAHHDAVLVPRLGGLQAVADLHLTGPWYAERQRKRGGASRETGPGCQPKPGYSAACLRNPSRVCGS